MALLLSYNLRSLWSAREVDTLRALGFSRGATLTCFVLESAALGLAGGLLGCALALPANGLSMATSGANYAEMAFAFRTTPGVLGIGIVFAGRPGPSAASCPRSGRRACRSPQRFGRREREWPDCAAAAEEGLGRRVPLRAWRSR